MKNNLIRWLEKKYDPSLCMVSVDTIVVDGAAKRIASVKQFLPQNNTFSGIIISQQGFFMEVEIDTDAGKRIINIELR